MRLVPFIARVFRFSDESSHIPNVQVMLDDVATEIDRQRVFVCEHRNRACSNAAYAMEALDENRSQRLLARIDQLTASIERDTRRLAALDKQAALVKQLRAVFGGIEVRKHVGWPVAPQVTPHPPKGLNPLSLSYRRPLKRSAVQADIRQRIFGL